MVDVADFVNSIAPSGNLLLDNELFKEDHQKNAIDTFRSRIFETLSYGTLDRLEENDFIGRLLLLGIIAAGESYFRSIMSITMELCPIAQSGAYEKTINLGGLLWHGKSGFSRSAFDNSSFAGSKELKKAAKDYIGFELQNRDFSHVLKKFDEICNLRHAIIHGDGILPGKNAIQLDIPRFQKPVRITVRYAHLQEASASVNALVSLFNRKLFDLLCQRWAIDWRKRIDWVSARQDRLFFDIWSAFICKSEMAQRTGRRRMRRSDCLAAVKAIYQI